MVCIRRLSIPHHFSQYPDISLNRMFKLFKNQYPCALAKDKSVSILVKRPAKMRSQCHKGTKAGKGKFTYSVVSSTNSYVIATLTNRIEGMPNSIGAGGASIGKYYKITFKLELFEKIYCLTMGKIVRNKG